ncbi:hypothetical protein F9C07_2679 [Aspergillus flavus]|uniref:Uncharacterized protein n=1 Tax=Aspergillus flavus (strain ATCC 200026 / FGSC A1120 / IAM 13836 / NRRL 3357 / JCM 12722 / SRRC 167) TaxID=332952 RepID=A0A7U2QS56_ASPFN|nr:hypothetical protein F9C07_2679 [Aspergillus flavus]
MAPRIAPFSTRIFNSDLARFSLLRSLNFSGVLGVIRLYTAIWIIPDRTISSHSNYSLSLFFSWSSLLLRFSFLYSARIGDHDGKRKVLGRLLHPLHSLCLEGVDACLMTFALVYRAGPGLPDFPLAWWFVLEHSSIKRTLVMQSGRSEPFPLPSNGDLGEAPGLQSGWATDADGVILSKVAHPMVLKTLLRLDVSLLDTSIHRATDVMIYEELFLLFRLI